MDQQQLSARQFGDRASHYLNSPVHATGADLERLATLAIQLKPARVLDVGCGAGHVSFALARGGAQHVTACDPSPSMLAVVAREAATRGIGAIDTCSAAAESLPFANDAFDIVATRYSAHHWASVPRALSECARVTRPGGRLIVIDVIAPESPLLDTSLQVIEFLRDGSHVRDYRVSEWVTMQTAAGFAEPQTSTWKVPIDFKSWIARIGTPPDRIAALHAVFAELPTEVREYFQVGPDRSFAMDSAWLESTKR